MSDGTGRITRLLAEAQSGRGEALDEVMTLVYADLRRIAQRRLRRQGQGVSLQPTELVHEGFLRLIKQRQKYDSRGHFFAIATRMMLRVLLDHHRDKRRVKRGGAQVRLSLGEVEETLPAAPGAEIPVFVEAVERLETLDARTAEIAKLRLLWGLTTREVADVLAVSPSTVERDWRFGRRWLSAELSA
jgi:RNA polymerase sigma factor (TIGR02999 family)